VVASNGTKLGTGKTSPARENRRRKTAKLIARRARRVCRAGMAGCLGVPSRGGRAPSASGRRATRSRGMGWVGTAEPGWPQRTHHHVACRARASVDMGGARGDPLSFLTDGSGCLLLIPHYPAIPKRARRGGKICCVTHCAPLERVVVAQRSRACY
jgi:hypothetical protein